MFYYQCSVTVLDGKRIFSFVYMIKTPTVLKFSEIVDCREFQRLYLKTVIKFDEMVSITLTPVLPLLVDAKLESLGLSRELIPVVTVA